MIIEPRQLPHDRCNSLNVWLNDATIHRIQKAAVARNVTKSTMLAIIVAEWIDLQNAIEEVELTQAANEMILTVEHPDAIDVRAAAAGEYAAKLDAHDGNDIQLSDFRRKPPRHD